MLQEEVPRHADSGEMKANPPAHLHINKRQGDRNSEAAIEHVVQKRIAGIVIVFPIPPKVRFLENDAVQSSQGPHRIEVGSHRRRPPGLAFNAACIFFDLELRILGAGDDQCTTNQVDFLVLDLRRHKDRECIHQLCGGGVVHILMLTMVVAGGIGPEVPVDGTFGDEPMANPRAGRSSFSIPPEPARVSAGCAR